MAPASIFILLFSLIKLWGSLFVDAKVFMVLMDDESVITYKTSHNHLSNEDALIYKDSIISKHDNFLDSLFQKGSYTKLYSYTHLLNGFAVHVTSEEAVNVLRNAKGVRNMEEDIKMEKMTTYTPEFLGIPTGVWPTLGGARNSGEGVVIGMIDTGINPSHPSFTNQLSGVGSHLNRRKFRGTCTTGNGFPQTACNGKIVGAHFYARGAIAAGDFNATRDYASPFDADGHGSHTASTAAGNHQIPVTVNGFNYGYASGMAPGAGIAVYKALYTFGGYMADVVAAVDQAVEDGIDILSLSIGPTAVPPGPSVFLNTLEIELLFATNAGVVVVQAAGNGGPGPSTILSFSPWITSAAASITDRTYNNTIILGNGQSFTGTSISPPTSKEVQIPIAAAADVCSRNTSNTMVENCHHTKPFIRSLVRGKLVICTYSQDFELGPASISKVSETIQNVGAAGFIITMDPHIGADDIDGTTLITLQVPGIILDDFDNSLDLWEYYNSHTIRNRNGDAVDFTATARIFDGRTAVYTGQGPIVASYSSRGPDVNNVFLQTADVLKPNVMAPGSSIWAAWSPNSEEDQHITGQNFALASGTSMATPHIAGIAALIKQKHPHWSPAAIVSAMMTTANVTDHLGAPIAQQGPTLEPQPSYRTFPATPFDFGSGAINPARALDPGLVFDIKFMDYIQFLCAVPGVDNDSVRQAVGIECPTKEEAWCSDLNTASITVSNLVGSRMVDRRVTNVCSEKEKYQVTLKEPSGVAVTVSPMVFEIRPNASRDLKIHLEAKEATNDYTFGELVLEGSKNHVVRVPLVVYVSSALGS
ncbi:subtilisin-like protease SBT2.5 [Macadamia integrifolia]|uniref:subtilisin-like protease SBT2.5 n=1 Tax=Macadamia integrifolia TaxID=60698 RepID=UPI001C4F344A|nr:subtilisin-like protease SBT2.5 [Macadamia integrifolia]